MIELDMKKCVELYEKNNIADVAREMKVSLQTMTRRLKKYELEHPEFKLHNIFSPWKGKIRSKEFGRAISLAKKGKPNPKLKGRSIPKPMLRGNKNPNWKGGKIETCGYVRVNCFDHPKKNKHNMIKEHRLIMEKHLGRYLKDDEIVHHINGITTDNRIENLQLMTASEHCAYHNKLRGKA